VLNQPKPKPKEVEKVKEVKTTSQAKEEAAPEKKEEVKVDREKETFTENRYVRPRPASNDRPCGKSGPTGAIVGDFRGDHRGRDRRQRPRGGFGRVGKRPSGRRFGRHGKPEQP